MLLKLREAAKELEEGDLGRTHQSRADAESLAIKDLLLGIFHHLEELNSKTSGLLTRPETR